MGFDCNNNGDKETIFLAHDDDVVVAVVAIVVLPLNAPRNVTRTMLFEGMVIAIGMRDSGRNP